MLSFFKPKYCSVKVNKVHYIRRFESHLDIDMGGAIVGFTYEGTIVGEKVPNGYASGQRIVRHSKVPLAFEGETLVFDLRKWKAC